MTRPVPARSRSTIAAPSGRGAIVAPAFHRLHARETSMPSLLRSRFAFRSVTVLALLLLVGLGVLTGPPAALAEIGRAHV